jgi:hypothetical protein
MPKKKDKRPTWRQGLVRFKTSIVSLAKNIRSKGATKANTAATARLQAELSKCSSSVASLTKELAACGCEKSGSKPASKEPSGPPMVFKMGNLSVEQDPRERDAWAVIRGGQHRGYFRFIGTGRARFVPPTFEPELRQGYDLVLKKASPSYLSKWGVSP